MSRVECVEVECKSALNRVQGMPFKWSVNPYSGCTHSCHYCYARAYYARAEHGNADRDFETRIFVKRNMARCWTVNWGVVRGVASRWRSARRRTATSPSRAGIG